MNEEDDDSENDQEGFYPQNKQNISIQLSFNDIVLLCIFIWCVMHDRLFALMTIYY